jgi:hypothetical protein
LTLCVTVTGRRVNYESQREEFDAVARIQKLVSAHLTKLLSVEAKALDGPSKRFVRRMRNTQIYAQYEESNGKQRAPTN